MDPNNRQPPDKMEGKFNIEPPIKIPGLKLNFQPPPSILRKLQNNEPINTNNSLAPRVRTLSNNDNKSYDELLKKVSPIDIARRLNFVHLGDMEEPDSPEHKRKQETSSMEVDANSDSEDEPIDLTHCIIPPEEREKLLKMDEEMKQKEISTNKKSKELDELGINVLTEKLTITPVVRSKSPPRPRLPCLFDDYEYCLEEQRQLKAKYKEKLRTQRMTGIAKVICYEIPQLPVPKIDFRLIPPPPPHIKVFKFDTPSPDELFRAEMERNKGKVKKPMFLVP